MKISLKRKIAMIMTFVLIVPILWNMNITIASAATPSLVQSNVEIVGAGETYQLEIKDKVDKSTYSWTSSNTNVAKVSSKGLVTSVNKGTSTVKCKITYPTKKTKTLSCKVTVIIPAKELKINNATLINGAHVMMLGSSMDFNCDLTPSNSSDKVFWSVGGGDAGCIRIDNVENGTVTAIKAGKVILRATAAKAATKDSAGFSIVNDAVIIEVVGPTATVKTADITESNKIVVTFDSPVNQSTVIGINGALSENIEVTMSKDTKNVVAEDPGKLTASLSTDGKTLTIISEKRFSGFYGINFTNKILTTDGIALETYYKKMTFIDVTPPELAATTYDDTGMIATINFTEPINFSNMVINQAKLVPINSTDTAASPNTLRTLNNAMNYTVSADNKSLSINLSKIEVTDYGKLFSIVISGITDLSGIRPVNNYLQPYLRYDNTAKPQAQPLFVQRTGYKTITATFDRAIQSGGYANIAGGSSMIGYVDTNNTKKVNYTLSDADALLTGVKVVSIGFWSGYFVSPSDTTASRMRDFNVDFTVDKTNPVAASVFDAETGILTLTYSEDVTLTNTTGIFVSTLTTATYDIRPNTNISYTRIVHSEGNKIIKLQLTGITQVGTYAFTLDQGFVTDNFRNASMAIPISINNASSTLTELPGPYYVTQNTDNLNKITLMFLNKLDYVSATTISNYTIAGIPIISAELKENSIEGGAIVELTVAEGSIKLNLDYPLTIRGVKGYNNFYSAITDYEKDDLSLKENERPYYLDLPNAPGAVFDKIARNNIRLKFSEEIQGTMTVRLTQTINGSTIEIPGTAIVDGSTVLISMSTPSNNSVLFIEIKSNTIKDMNGNSLAPNVPLKIPVIITY